MCWLLKMSHVHARTHVHMESKGCYTRTEWFVAERRSIFMSSLVIDLLAEVWLWLVQTEPDRRKCIGAGFVVGLLRTHTRIVEAACGTDTCRLPACLHGYLSWPQILHWANSLQALQVIAWQTGRRWKKQGEQAHPAQKVWCQHPMGAKRVESNVSIQNGEIDSPIFGEGKLACLNAKSMR